MAILLTLTIIFSATYSILWFMPLMYWYGPSNEDYDTPFKKWYKDIRNKMKGSQGNSAQPSSVQESDM